MRKVYQTTVDAKIGNCMQAAHASLFHLQLSQVPNYILFDDKAHGNYDWWQVYTHFIKSLGYVLSGYGYPIRHDIPREKQHSIALEKSPTVGGAIYASVKSKSFIGGSHAVLINRKGIVIHDPNPSKAFLGIDVVASGELISWELIKKIRSKK